jgi:Ca2+-binding RTX toxin-like protein
MRWHRAKQRAPLLIAGTLLAVTNVAAVAPTHGGIEPLCHGRVATILGNAAPNDITGTPGRDVILGRGGNDHIKGRGGDDFICGNHGNDELEGQPGRDHLYGGVGFDHVEGGLGADVCRAEQRRSC